MKYAINKQAVTVKNKLMSGDEIGYIEYWDNSLERFVILSHEHFVERYGEVPKEVSVKTVKSKGALNGKSSKAINHRIGE